MVENVNTCWEIKEVPEMKKSLGNILSKMVCRFESMHGNDDINSFTFAAANFNLNVRLA